VVDRFRRLRRLLRKIGLRPGPTRKEPKRRAVAVVVDGDQVLVMRRSKRGREYAVLPGGAVEAGETVAEAALRELQEETTLVAEIDRLLWTGWHNGRPAWYFLMTAVRGCAELSGPEALANGPDNRYELRWVTADQFAELGLHPSDIRGPLTDLLAGRPGSVQ
jgi:ADP-ribose pyrophosphatase YjhB (NUDIX family)